MVALLLCDFKKSLNILVYVQFKIEHYLKCTSGNSHLVNSLLAFISKITIILKWKDDL